MHSPSIGAISGCSMILARVRGFQGQLKEIYLCLTVIRTAVVAGTIVLSKWSVSTTYELMNSKTHKTKARSRIEISVRGRCALCLSTSKIANALLVAVVVGLTF